MIDQFNILLNNNWTNDEKNMIKRIMDGLLFFKKLLPNSLKNDVILAINLCNELKNENELLKKQLSEFL